MPSAVTTRRTPSSSIDYYDRLVQESVASGTAETRNDRSRVTRASEDVRVGDILSLLSQPHRAPTSIFASFLAVLDFNSRNSTFLSSSSATAAVDGNDNDDDDDGGDNNNILRLREMERCDFYLSIRYRDPQYNPVRDGRYFQEEYLLDDDDDDDDDEGNNTGANAFPSRIRGMAVLGPTRSAEAQIVAKMGDSIPNNFNTAGDEKDAATGKLHEGAAAVATAAASSEERQVSINPNAIPNIASSATSAELEDRTQYPYFARTTPTNRVDAIALGWYLKSIGVRRLAVLYVSDIYGRAYVAGVREAARMQRIRLLVASYHDGVDESLNGAINRLRAANFTYHMLIPASSDQFWKPVVYELADASLIGVPDKMWFFGDSMNVFNRDMKDPRLAKALNRTAGVFTSALDERNEAMNSRMLHLLEDDEAVEYFLSKQVSGPLAEVQNATQFRSDYGDLLHSHLPALMTYDAVIALGLAACQTPNEFFTGPELYETLKGVRFGGASGEVSFDNVTATRLFANVSIFNVFVEPNGTKIGSGLASVFIDPQNGRIETLRPLVFGDGSTTPPPSLDPLVENMNLLSKAEQATCWALSGIVLVCAAVCAVWTVVHRQKPAVKAGQPAFLLLLAIGSFVLGCAIIPTTFQEPMSRRTLDAGCMLGAWLFSIGFSTSFAALFSKTQRINRVFIESTRGRRIQVQVKDVLVPFIVLLTANVLLLVLWTLVRPLEWSRIPTDVDLYGRTMSSVGSCMRHLDPVQIAFASLTVGVNFTTLCLSNWMTYQARNLPAQFNDNPFVGIANFILLECAFVGAPILFVTSGDPSSFVVVLSLLLSIISAAILLPVVLPFALKPRGHDNHANAASMRMLAHKWFDPSKARCGIQHYPLSAADTRVFGTPRVRVTGLPTTPTTGADTASSFTHRGRESKMLTAHSPSQSQRRQQSTHGVSDWLYADLVEQTYWQGSGKP